ncbi:MAG: CDP-alcohol phosphatidyltransferase family protein [Chloroflexi bacterium]|nr:CDP-alcohol phosphatidyltransferase family protein [Chloroflexota bacterium]
MKPPFILSDWMRQRAAFILTPIVTFLARYRLSPDAVTVAGFLSHFFFAWLVATGRMTAAGFAILIIAPLDAVDGALARQMGRKQGGFGAFLDSTLDRVAEIILFGGFISYYVGEGNEAMLAIAYIAITGSLMVSYARSRAEGLGYDCKVGILGRFERYIVLIVFLILDLPEISLMILAALTYFTLLQRMVHVWKQTQ